MSAKTCESPWSFDCSVVILRGLFKGALLISELILNAMEWTWPWGLEESWSPSFCIPHSPWLLSEETFLQRSRILPAEHHFYWSSCFFFFYFFSRHGVTVSYLRLNWAGTVDTVVSDSPWAAGRVFVSGGLKRAEDMEGICHVDFWSFKRAFFHFLLSWVVFIVTVKMNSMLPHMCQQLHQQGNDSTVRYEQNCTIPWEN